MGHARGAFSCFLSQTTLQRPETFTLLSLHICNIFAQKRCVAKKLILTIRAIMLGQHIDLIAGDFNGTAWRCSNRNNVSTLEEAFADCALPAPQGPTADVCGFLKPPESDRYWTVRLHGALSIRHEALSLRPTDQSCHHETWLHLAIVDWHSTQSHHDDHDRPAIGSRTSLRDQGFLFFFAFARIVAEHRCTLGFGTTAVSGDS